MIYFIKSYRTSILILIISSLSYTAQARESITNLRADLNATVMALQAQITALQEQVDTLHPTILYEIGDRGSAGGIVFYVTDDGDHGLEAAPEDQSSNAEWECSGVEIPGANGTTVGTGAQNTQDILAGCNEINSATDFADRYVLNGFGDWFLPSLEEMNLLYLQKDRVGGFSDEDSFDGYWSSTEVDALRAKLKFFPSNSIFNTAKSIDLRVRAIRAFNNLIPTAA